MTDDDTHDELVKTYLRYFEANEDFERSPSERSKRRVRRELRQLMTLAKARQGEVKAKYDEVLVEIRNSHKWEANRTRRHT
jgi:hypothetical protein|tara:strand:- start:303 stop:545 length:243 start_codon:yes stop_codon:yes gene_type:complete